MFRDAFTMHTFLRVLNLNGISSKDAERYFNQFTASGTIVQTGTLGYDGSVPKYEVRNGNEIIHIQKEKQ